MSEQRQIRTNRNGRSSAPQRNGRPIRRSEAGRPVQRSHAQHPNGPRPNGRRPSGHRPRKAKKKLRWWIPFLAIVCVLGVSVGAALGYVHSILHAILPSDQEEAQFNEQIATAPEFKGDVVNILLLGMDFEDGREFKVGKNGEKIGNTDMILYLNYDLKNKKMNMLQIPRDLFVNDPVVCNINGEKKTYRTPSGKINGLALHNEDEYEALANVIAQQLKLPVDYYASINMEALVSMVDTFGGIEVYVPQEITGKGGSIPQGTHTLNGAAVNFMLRQRHMYANMDVGRLNTQRYFYSALFKRVRTATLGDIIKLMPVIKNYVTTNIPLSDMIALAYNFLSIDSSNIMVAQMPFYPCTKNFHPNPAKNFNGYWVGVPDRQGTADLLNQYFRTYSGEVPAEDLKVEDDWPHQPGATSPNVQFMGQLDQAGTPEAAADNAA